MGTIKIVGLSWIQLLLWTNIGTCTAFLSNCYPKRCLG